MSEITQELTPYSLLDKLSQAEKEFFPYHDLVKETRAYYKDSRTRYSINGRYNIFWSSIETLKPFLYFKQPEPYIERITKMPNITENLACRIMEKALQWDLSQFDFDSVIKYARNDFLISGCGIIWERYQPEFQEVKNPDGSDELISIKIGEKVVSEYINPEHFLCDTDNVGIWEDVKWVGRKLFLKRCEITSNFGEEFKDNVNPDETVCVYEVWYKPLKKVYWISRDYPHKFLKEIDDPLHLSGFFPCPKPIFATQTNDSIIPTPDYCLIKEMLQELNGITQRMKLVMQALKVSGAYDKSFPELYNILNKDVTLVAVSDFQKLKDNGGIRGIIDFAPIDQYIQALEQLSVRREDIIKRIYDVTGVSDIMRGNANTAETATAVVQKTNFGTLRNQDRQNDMQRFIADLFRIKAEIICEQFSEKTLADFLSGDEQRNQLDVSAAILLLKTEKLRGMVLRVESDAVFNQEAEHKKTIDSINTVNTMIKEAFALVSTQPLLLPLYRGMIEAVIATMPKARQFETILEQTFNNISKDLQRPDNLPTQNVQNNLAEVQQEKNDLKRRELDIKAFSEQEKALINRAELQLKQERQTNE
ncbi:MAG: hypothetical protein IJ660_05635 [Alphaproteobacteria bacterium]|nr:hypothetical protein [Alphaproteobacteria bacterium]